MGYDTIVDTGRKYIFKQRFSHRFLFVSIYLLFIIYQTINKLSYMRVTMNVSERLNIYLARTLLRAFDNLHILQQEDFNIDLFSMNMCTLYCM